MKAIIYIEGAIYTLLPALAVLADAENPLSFKTVCLALSAGLGGLKAFLSTTYSTSLGDDAKDQLQAENVRLKNYNGQLNSMVQKPIEQMLAEAQAQLAKPAEVTAPKIGSTDGQFK